MPRFFGMQHRYAAAYPKDKDFTLFNHHQAQRLGAGGGPNDVLDLWIHRHGESWRGLAKTGINRGSGMGANYYSCYFDEFHSTAMHEETVVFFSEWSGGEVRQIDPPEEKDTLIWAAGTGGIVPSYVDFATWYAAEWLRRGFGIYYDNAFPKRAYDPVTTSAYDMEEYGFRQPSAGIWAHRDYMKRVWVLHRQLFNPRTPQMMMIHMTNTHIVPYMVFNDANLDLELLSGPQPAQSKFGHAFLRAESLGRQSGNIPLVLAISEPRTRWAAMLIHEIKLGIASAQYPEVFDSFGYGLDDCVAYNYWDRDNPVHATDDRAKTLLLKRNGELMLLVVNWAPEKTEVDLTIDLEALDVRPDQAIDAETSAVLPWKNATLHLDLDVYGVCVVHFR